MNDPKTRRPGAIVAVALVFGGEACVHAMLALAALRGGGIHWIIAGFDVVLVLGLLARNEAARMVALGLVALGIVTSLWAIGSANAIAGIVGVVLRVAMFRAIDSAAVRAWTAEPETPRSFSGLARRRRRE